MHLVVLNLVQLRLEKVGPLYGLLLRADKLTTAHT
jgi:hypothetical protein